MPVFVFCLTLLSMLSLSDAALASIKTQVSARRVGVGQPIVVQITATQQDGEPEPGAPQLEVNGAAQVQGPSISSQSMVRMHNFSFSSEKNVVARYQVIPQKEGKLTIGPGSFQVGGRRIAGETIVVEVVSADQAQQRQQARRPSLFGNDPFDPFGNDPFDDFFKRHSRRVQMPEAPPEYKLDRAADPIAFLRTTVSSKKAVVGEPILLTILGYGSRGDFGEALPPNGPALPDFLSFRTIDNSQSEPPYQFELGGELFVVRKLREFILIPLKTGSLQIGSLETVLQSNRRAYPKKGNDTGYGVSSKPITIEVTEPPTTGRPDGYLVGDVGRYRLEAELSHDKVVQGEFAELVVRLTGEGNIPSKVLLPEQNGVVWEAPTVSGGPEVRDGILQGTRVIKYAVQLTQTGKLHLGEVTLPVYNHRSDKYQVLRADLGEIEVTPAPARSAPHGSGDLGAQDREPRPDPIIAEPMSPRRALLPYDTDRRERFPSWSWWAMGLSPLSVLLGGSVSRGLRIWSRRRNERTGSNTKAELKAAEEALREGDRNRALSLAERALFDAIERATGIKARGLLRNEVAQGLAKAGLNEALANDAQGTLQRLEECRYGSPEDDPAALFSQVRSLVGKLSTAKVARAKR